LARIGRVQKVVGSIAECDTGEQRLGPPIRDWRLAVLEGAASAAPYQPATGNAS
jgi:hypothetical protein